MNANPLSKTPIQQPSVSLGDVAVATAKEVFVPAMATASTMRELINDELNALHVSQLQNVLDYVRNLRTRRAA
jgi:hypothetical protein